MSQEPLLPLYNAREPEPETGRTRFVVIRFSDVGIQDLPIDITQVPYSSINTHWLREKCREYRRDETGMKRLKFICSGAMLNSHTDLSNDLNRYFIQQRAGNEESRFYIHCIVGTETLTPEQVANEDSLDDIAPSSEGTTTQAIGFDRLRAVGFSDQEIELLREQFRAAYGDLEEEMANNQQRDIRQLEEQWMESDARNNTNGLTAGGFNSVPIANYKHNRDLLIGICIGFFLGVFGLLLMKMNGLFNKRQKMSIFAGIIVNIMFNIVRKF